MNGTIKTIRIHAEVFAAPRWLRTMSAIVSTQITRRIRPSRPPTASKNTGYGLLCDRERGIGPSSAGAGRTGNGAHRCVGRDACTPDTGPAWREARRVLRADRPGPAPPEGGREPLPAPESPAGLTDRGVRERYGLLFVATIALLGIQGAVPPGRAQQIVVTTLRSEERRVGK